MRLRLKVARGLDRIDQWIARVVEPDGWVQEYREYVGDPRLLPIETWVRYSLARVNAFPVTDPAAFWQHSPYPLLRQLIHRRHASWRVVLATMRRASGTLIEFGCGIAPVSAWCAPRRPEWNYVLVDWKSPHRDYGEWRLRGLKRLVQDDIWVSPHADVVTALDVFEHTENPLPTAQRLVDRLKPGGFLHWNFVETGRENLDLASPEQRRETIQYLRDTLRVVWECPTYIVSTSRP